MRESGLLLHPTSLPGPEGIGTLGKEAKRFVDLLASAGQSCWQLLPLGPTGLFNSPYMTSSALAGNPLLIDMETCIREGWLGWDALEVLPNTSPDAVDFAQIMPWKAKALRTAFEGFKAHATDAARQEMKAFCAEHKSWLDDFALFVVLGRLHDDRSWVDWPTPLRDRLPQALNQARVEHVDALEAVRFEQYVFFKQWGDLKTYANARGVELIGDIPIFVSHNSADVWAFPELFYLDGDGQPTVIAGVPPDYFSATGQRWGNPLYRWDRMEARGFAWWIERFRLCMAMVDRVRIDHFRGFEAYWEIPVDHETAIHGTWKPGPGKALFDKVHEALGALPIIAEDLGIITPEVEALRDDLDFPGMKILHFAFSNVDDPAYATNDYLPHNFIPHCVAYTGTHDNDTTHGWYSKLPGHQAHHVRIYLSASGQDIAWSLMRSVWMSVANLAVAPVQDVLSLGTEARMNTPGTADGNWNWRMRPDAFAPHHTERLRGLTSLSGRLVKHTP